MCTFASLLHVPMEQGMQEEPSGDRPVEGRQVAAERQPVLRWLAKWVGAQGVQDKEPGVELKEAPIQGVHVAVSVELL